MLIATLTSRTSRVMNILRHVIDRRLLRRDYTFAISNARRIYFLPGQCLRGHIFKRIPLSIFHCANSANELASVRIARLRSIGGSTHIRILRE